MDRVFPLMERLRKLKEKIEQAMEAA